MIQRRLVLSAQNYPSLTLKRRTLAGRSMFSVSHPHVWHPNLLEWTARIDPSLPRMWPIRMLSISQSYFADRDLICRVDRTLF